MEIDALGRLAGRHQTIDAVERRQQPAQLGLAFQHDGAAPGLDLRQEAAGDDRITEALFGMDEQGPSLKRLASPLRKRIGAGRVIGQVSPQFVGLPAFLEAPELQQRQRPVPRGAGSLRFEAVRGFELGHRSLEVGGLLEGDAVIVPGRMVVWPSRGGPAMSGQPFLEAAEVLEHVAEVAEDAGVVRIQFEGPAVAQATAPSNAPRVRKAIPRLVHDDAWRGSSVRTCV